MNYSLEKLFNKFKTYYYYLANENSRKYFFILISRKIFNLFNKSSDLKKANDKVFSWCKRKTISEKKFYLKIGLRKHRNFFEEKKSYYISAKLKEKKLNYKMGGMAHLNLIYNLTKYCGPKKYLKQEWHLDGLHWYLF